MSETEETDLTGAVDRALTLLSAVLADRGTHGIGQIAAGLGLPVSTTHRLVSNMVRHKLLIRMERGRYVASHRIALAGGEAVAWRALAIAARPVLRALATEIRATTHLGVLDGEMVTYLVKESPPGVALFTREGMQLEAYCSAVGKILLAQLPDPALDTYLGGEPLVALTSQTITDKNLLREHLARVRQDDHAIDDREIADDLVCLGVPIRLASGAVIAGISCSVAGPGLPLPDTISRLTNAAATIEDCL